MRRSAILIILAFVIALFLNLSLTEAAQYDYTLFLVQKQLGESGFDAGVPDGINGQKTRSAIEAFEKSKGMKTTGQVSIQLIGKLSIDKKTLSPNPSKSEIQQVICKEMRRSALEGKTIGRDWKCVIDIIKIEEYDYKQGYLRVFAKTGVYNKAASTFLKFGFIDHFRLSPHHKKGWIVQIIKNN